LLITYQVGKNGVATIYDYRYAPKVWEFIQEMKEGVAIFTQPKTGIKCGGAPQKIMWLAEDYWRNQTNCRSKVEVEFVTGMPTMFPVPKYSETLDAMRGPRQVGASFQHDLVEVDGKNKVATFELPDGKRVKKKFDFLHVVPKMGPHPCIKASPLADKATGFVTVDPGTLQHTSFSNVFGIGDCTNLPTSKTAAAITGQAPVLVHNLVQVMDGKEPTARYNGYTSCPILTKRGGLILAEFKYDGELEETFGGVVDQSQERLAFYYLKTKFFPWAYWNLLITGRWFGPKGVFEPRFD